MKSCHGRVYSRSSQIKMNLYYLIFLIIQKSYQLAPYISEYHKQYLYKVEFQRYIAFRDIHLRFMILVWGFANIKSSTIIFIRAISSSIAIKFVQQLVIEQGRIRDCGCVIFEIMIIRIVHSDRVIAAFNLKFEHTFDMNINVYLNIL